MACKGLLPLLTVLLLGGGGQSLARPQSETTSIEGFVVEVGTNLPVPDAAVLLDAVDESEGVSDLVLRTDAAGRFSMIGLPPGAYRIHAARDGFLPSEYGQSALGRRGAIVTLGEGEAVRDLGGNPVPGARVEALGYDYEGGGRTLTFFEDAMTGEDGRYSLSGLSPGRYFLSAVPDVGDGEAVRFLPVYYPNTIDFLQAASVDVRSGVDAVAVDIVVAFEQGLTVTGRLLAPGADGLPGSALLRLSPRGVGVERIETLEFGPDGEWEISALAPGSYDLIITVPAHSIAPDGSIRSRTSYVRTVIEVSDSDPEEMTLPLRRAFTLAGTISFDGDRSGDQVPELLGTRVELREDGEGSDLGPVARVGDYGRFILENVVPGRHRLVLYGMPNGGYLKSARIGVVDVLESGVTLEDDPRNLLEIVIGRNGGVVDVLVLEDESPVADATVVLVPDPPLRERADTYAVGRSDGSGNARLTGVVPGRYRAFAWDGIEFGSWRDPDVMIEYEAYGTPVRVDGGLTTRLQLELLQPAVRQRLSPGSLAELPRNTPKNSPPRPPEETEENPHR